MFTSIHFTFQIYEENEFFLATVNVEPHSDICFQPFAFNIKADLEVDVEFAHIGIFHFEIKIIFIVDTLAMA